MSLRQIIEQEIRERGPIPFSRYMELCLYHPELGYYSRNAEQFGKAGDFYTSSDVHAIFGRLLARQFEEIWQSWARRRRLKFWNLAPGRGLFAQDVLDWSEKKFSEFFRALHYSLSERSPALRQTSKRRCARFVESGGFRCFRQARPKQDRRKMMRTAEREGHDFSRADDDRAERALAPEVPRHLFANEFFDALPVEIVSPQGPFVSRLRTVDSSKPGFHLRRKNWNFSTDTASIPNQASGSKSRCWRIATWRGLAHRYIKASSSRLTMATLDRSSSQGVIAAP